MATIPDIWRYYPKARFPASVLFDGHQQDPDALAYGHHRPGINLRATPPRELRALDKATRWVWFPTPIELTEKVELHECAVLHYSTDTAVVRFANRITECHVCLEAVQGFEGTVPGRSLLSELPLADSPLLTSLWGLIEEQEEAAYGQSYHHDPDKCGWSAHPNRKNDRDAE